MNSQQNSTNGNKRQQSVEIKDLQVKQDPKGGPHYSDFGGRRRSRVSMGTNYGRVSMGTNYGN